MSKCNWSFGAFQTIIFYILMYKFKPPSLLYLHFKSHWNFDESQLKRILFPFFPSKIAFGKTKLVMLQNLWSKKVWNFFLTFFSACTFHANDVIFKSAFLSLSLLYFHFFFWFLTVVKLHTSTDINLDFQECIAI